MIQMPGCIVGMTRIIGLIGKGKLKMKRRILDIGSLLK